MKLDFLFEEFVIHVYRDMNRKFPELICWFRIHPANSATIMVMCHHRQKYIFVVDYLPCQTREPLCALFRCVGPFNDRIYRL